MNFEFNWGLIPFVIFNVVISISAVIDLVFGIISIFHGGNPAQIGLLFGLSGFQFLLVYMSFVTPAIITIIRDNERMNLTTKNKIIGMLTYMFFFYDFALAFLDGFFHPNKKTNWKRVKHTGEVTNSAIK